MERVHYQRCRFTTELPARYRYTPTHFWLDQQDDVWRVGFTKFAGHVLGELVEWGIKAQPGEKVAAGQAIGFYEGFKAVTDLWSVADGEFVRANAELELNGGWIKTDPYGQGWLYEVRGTPAPEVLAVDDYCAVLDATIDKLQGG